PTRRSSDLDPPGPRPAPDRLSRSGHLLGGLWPAGHLLRKRQPLGLRRRPPDRQRSRRYGRPFRGGSGRLSGGSLWAGYSHLGAGRVGASALNSADCFGLRLSFIDISPRHDRHWLEALSRNFGGHGWPERSAQGCACSGFGKGLPASAILQNHQARGTPPPNLYPQTASDTSPQASSKSLVGKRENEERTKR